MKVILQPWIQAGFRPEYGDQDNDTLMFLEALQEYPPTKGLEVGANDEASAQILTNAGYRITGVDLLADHKQIHPINYERLVGDFVPMVDRLPGNYDFAWSTSAIEHFGCPIYGAPVVDPDYDSKAMEGIYRLLKPGGKAYITVPYGKNYIYSDDWRIYNRQALQDRLIRNFQLVSKSFFLSGECQCPHKDNRVLEADADRYESDSLPHVTVLLVLQKPRREYQIIDEGMVGALPAEFLTVRP